MKKLLFLTLIVLVVLSTGCQVAPAAPAGEPVLTLTAGTQSKTFTLEEIKKLPAAQGQAGTKSSTGKISPPVLAKGVLLSELLNQVGGADSSMSVQVEAKDGYAMTLSVDQINNGDFIAYDPGTGDETKNAGKLQVLMAYEMDGKPLDKEKDGNLRMVVINDKPNQVTDGHWSVKWVTKITVKPLVLDWTLHLEGTLTEDMDRGTFESGAAENCHKAAWTDGKAQEWVGIPLYLLVGRVDDEVKHDGPAFSDELADKGYIVDVVAKDGFMASFDSARVKRNKNLIVAYLVNGNPLNDKDLPLKLVGSDIKDGKESIGGIAKIVIHFKEGAAVPTAEATSQAATTPESPASGAAALMIKGLVEKETSWTMDDLKKMEVVKLSVEHPKKGKQDAEGVRLNALLDLVGPKPEAKTIVLTAGDGFTAEVDLKSVRGCKDCLLAFNESGQLKSVMPGMDSSLWVKDIVQVEVK